MLSGMSPRTTRARPLSRDERREAILTAVTPLLIEKGAMVTTAEMAEAAGIAEGTIFRAFPDKAELLHEAVRAVMDPGPAGRALAEIPADLPRDTQLTEACVILAAHFERIAALVGMVRSMPHPVEKPSGDAHRFAVESMAEITASVASIVERHSEQLAMDSARVAVALRGLIFTNAHPLLATEEKLTPAEIVHVVLHGIGPRKAT